MSFGQDKCAYIYVEQIKELNEGDRYTYLGIDESVGMDEELSKEKVQTEYRFTLVPVIVGCLGAVPATLTSNLLKLGISLKESDLIARRLQKAAVIRSLTVMKTAIRMF